MDFEPREEPKRTLEWLLPPKEGFPYFNHAERFPFEPDAVDLSAANAWWLADASLLVYGDADFVSRALGDSPLPNQGFSLEWLGRPEENFGFVLRRGPLHIVVFRGTRVDNIGNFLRDLLTDVRIPLADFSAGGKVHGGFLKMFLDAKKELEPFLMAETRSQKVWLAGHSLGGALATVAAAYLGRRNVQGLYTYGAPSAGDRSFRKILPTASHFRFVHRKDWVPPLPPKLLGYAHGGTLIKVAGAPAETGSGRLKKIVGEAVKELYGWADHAPVYYATRLWNKLVV